MSVCAEINPENAAVQAEIADVHNAFRRAVQPSASNMLKLVSPAFTVNLGQIIFANMSQHFFAPHLLEGKNKVDAVCCIPLKNQKRNKQLFKVDQYHKKKNLYVL